MSSRNHGFTPLKPAPIHRNRTGAHRLDNQWAGRLFHASGQPRRQAAAGARLTPGAATIGGATRPTFYRPACLSGCTFGGVRDDWLGAAGGKTYYRGVLSWLA